MENSIYWKFTVTGSFHLLEVPSYWKLTFAGSSHLLKVPIFLNFPFTGSCRLLKVSIYWKFPFTESSNLLEVPIYWKFSLESNTSHCSWTSNFICWASAHFLPDSLLNPYRDLVPRAQLIPINEKEHGQGTFGAEQKGNMTKASTVRGCGWVG